MPEHHTSFNDGNPIFNCRNALVLTAVDLGCEIEITYSIDCMHHPPSRSPCIDHRCSVCFCLMVCNGLSRVRVSVRAINMCMMHAMCGCVVCVRGARRAR